MLDIVFGVFAGDLAVTDGDRLDVIGCFLGGFGEFVGDIELISSFACLRAKRLWRCMFIRVSNPVPSAS